MFNDRKEYYEERVGRYRIVCHEELPDRHKAEMRINGIDPDTRWSLIWSFDKLESAELQLERCNERKASYETFKLVDNGEEEIILRSVFF